MAFKDFLESKIMTRILIGALVIATLLLVFRLGMWAGYQRAETSHFWAESYPIMFGVPPPPGAEDFMLRPTMEGINSHGLSGTVLKNESGGLLLDTGTVERTILINDDTKIRRGVQDIRAQDINMNDHAVIVGEPDREGQIIAHFIRIFPNQ